MNIEQILDYFFKSEERLPKCEGPNKDGPGYGGLINPNGSVGGRGTPGANNALWAPVRSRSDDGVLLFERSEAPGTGGARPDISDEAGLLPIGGVERLEGFMPTELAVEP